MTPEEILKNHTTKSGHCDIIKAMEEYASLRERETAILFSDWKDFNYINYQMQDGKYYHKRDLLKHISEATVFTTDELYTIFEEQNKSKI